MGRKMANTTPELRKASARVLGSLVPGPRTGGWPLASADTRQVRELEWTRQVQVCREAWHLTFPCARMYTRPHVHTPTCALARTHRHIRAQTDTQTHAEAHARVCTRARIHARTHMRTRGHTHAHVWSVTHTRTRAHTDAGRFFHHPKPGEPQGACFLFVVNFSA